MKCLLEFIGYWAICISAFNNSRLQQLASLAAPVRSSFLTKVARSTNRPFQEMKVCLSTIFEAVSVFSKLSWASKLLYKHGGGLISSKVHPELERAGAWRYCQRGHASM